MITLVTVTAGLATNSVRPSKEQLNDTAALLPQLLEFYSSLENNLENSPHLDFERVADVDGEVYDKVAFMVTSTWSKNGELWASGGNFEVNLTGIYTSLAEIVNKMLAEFDA